MNTEKQNLNWLLNWHFLIMLSKQNMTKGFYLGQRGRLHRAEGWTERERSRDRERRGGEGARRESHSVNSWAVWADFQQAVRWVCQTDKLTQCMGTVPGGGQAATSSWPRELFLHVFPLWPRFLFLFLDFSHFFISHFISAVCYLLVIWCICFPISTGSTHSLKRTDFVLFSWFWPSV